MHMLKASEFRWLNTCQRRVWRDVHMPRGLRDEVPLFRRSVLEAGVAQEEQIHLVTAPRTPRVIVRSWAEGVQFTKNSMRDGIPVILGAYLELEMVNPISQEPVKLGGIVDRLERQDSGLYAPVEVKLYDLAHENDQLQLAFYVWLLCQLQGVDTLPASFWLGLNGDRTPKNVLPLTYDAQSFEVQLLSALRLIDGPEPGVELIPDCHKCHWYSACYPEAADKKHVSLLSGLRPATRQDFALEGIKSLDQIVLLAPDDLRKLRGIKTTAPGIYANARAWVEERAVWYGELHQDCRTPAIYFDIETIPMGTKPDVWSIGWARENEPVQVVMVDSRHRSGYMSLPRGAQVMLVPDTDSAWRFFANSVADSDLPIFHWTAYDSTVLKNSGPSDVAERLLPRLRDLHKFFDKAVKLPIKGTSLKTVGVHLGFNWKVYDDFMAAYMDYQKWVVRSKIESLESASAYQQDDITAMIVVRQWLAENEELL